MIKVLGEDLHFFGVLFRLQEKSLIKDYSLQLVTTTLVLLILSEILTGFPCISLAPTDLQGGPLHFPH